MHFFWKLVFILTLLVPFFHLEANELWEEDIPDFSFSSYEKAVHSLFLQMEKSDPDRFTPKGFKRVGLKVSTQMGAGLSTPLALTKAVISFLETKGFEKNNIFIVDQEAHLLRNALYLPLLSKRSNLFEGVPVYALSDGNYFSEKWFYESPLPPPSDKVDFLQANKFSYSVPDETSRKSFIAAPLLFGLDFWINLPVAFDSPRLGLRGASVNSSLHLINNTDRFYNSSINGAIAVAEINSIPELRSKLAANIISLESYQYIGGPIFDANFTSSENLIIASFHGVAMDELLLKKINDQRMSNGFTALASEPEYFSLLEKLNQRDSGDQKSQDER